MIDIVFQATAAGGTLDASTNATTVVLRGNSGDDLLIGGSGDDRLDGGSGHDGIVAGAGNDAIFAALSPMAFGTVDGGSGIDSLYIALNGDQYTPDVRLALSALKTFITSTVVADPGARFTDGTLHLDMTGVERAFIRLDGVVTDLAYFSLPEVPPGTPQTGPLGGTVTVHATDALYDYASAVSGLGATPPVSLDIGTGTGRAVTLSDVVGSFSFGEGAVGDAPLATGPDGADLFGGAGTLMGATNGLAGLTTPSNGMLVGVFLDGHEQDAGHVTPAALDFRSLGEGFATLAPAIDQPFFIGDGLTGTGATQTFLAPDAARTLVLGVVDGTRFQGSPGAYADNSGFVTAHVAVQDHVWGG